MVIFLFLNCAQASGESEGGGKRGICLVRIPRERKQQRRHDGGTDGPSFREEDVSVRTFTVL